MMQEEHFASQARACDRLGSPFTARLCRMLPRLLNERSLTGGRIQSWPGDPAADALALRLVGGLHGLVLSGEHAGLAAVYPPNEAPDDLLEEALLAALAHHDAALSKALDSPPQTNEIARAAMLLPGFLAIGREFGMPMAVREIGASAGLNLLFDQFHYRYGDSCWGDEASPVKLVPQVHGTPPPLGGFLDVSSRAGCDLAPVNVANGADRLRLKSYVWADQKARLERLEAAISLVEQTPVTLQRADASGFLAAQLAQRNENEVFVLFHSIMWQYLPGKTQRQIENCLDEAGNVAGAPPLAWLRMEPISPADSCATLRLSLWPGGQTRDLARCDYHGRWIEWVAGTEV